MASRDLTTLQNVKNYLGIQNLESDALLGRLITAMSAAFVAEVGREVLRNSRSDILDGDDERVQTRPYFTTWPISAVGFAISLDGPVIGDPVVTVDGAVIPKRATLTDTGWVLLDRYRLELAGFQFTKAVANVSLVYEAGEYVPAEAVTIPATPGPYTVQAAQALGTFVSDIGVKYASSGTALAKVTAGPAAGQYSVNATGLYTFAAADQAVAVLLSYAILPADVEDCVIEMVAFKYRKRDRLDQVSANIGGQSVFFSRDAWPVTIQQVIDRYGVPNV